MEDMDVKDEGQETNQSEETQQNVSKESWDKEKQRADQNEANFRKIQKQFEDFQEEHQQAVSVIEDLKAELVSLREKREEVKDELDDLDETQSDPTLVKHLRKLNEQIKRAQGDLAKANAKIAQYEQVENQKAEESRRNSVKEEVLSFCDNEYGAKYRALADKKANELVDNGIERQPKSITEAIALLSKCYKMVRAEDDEKSKTKSKTPTDTGKGGVKFDFADEIKPGSIDDVVTQMKKKLKF